MIAKIVQSFRRIVGFLLELNLFAEPETVEKNDIQIQRKEVLSTRVYLILMGVSVTVIVLLTMLPQNEVKITVMNPSITTYDRLESDYLDTLSCSCENIAIPLKLFLSVQPRFHEICSSMFVSSIWIESLFSEDATRLSPLDIRLTAAAQFRLLALMCNFTQTTIGDAINSFLQEEIVNAHLISRPSFEIQTESLFAELNTRLDWSLRSQRVGQIVMFLIKQNRIHTVVNTNAFHLSEPGSNIYQSIDSYYPLYDNASFTRDPSQFSYCDALIFQAYKAGIYSWDTDSRSILTMMDPDPPPIYVVPGMRVGCMPYDTLLSSTLECFYDQACINTTASFISKLAPNDWPKALNQSITRFRMQELVASIFELQIIEEWRKAKYFDSYYAACTPFRCTYQIFQRNDYIYLLTLLLGLFGGITVVIRFLAPLIVTLGQAVYNALSKKFKKNTKVKHSSESS